MHNEAIKAKHNTAMQCDAMQIKAKQTNARHRQANNVMQSNAAQRESKQSEAKQSNVKQSNAKQCDAVRLLDKRKNTKLGSRCANLSAFVAGKQKHIPLSLADTKCPRGGHRIDPTPAIPKPAFPSCYQGAVLG